MVLGAGLSGFGLWGGLFARAPGAATGVELRAGRSAFRLAPIDLFLGQDAHDGLATSGLPVVLNPRDA